VDRADPFLIHKTTWRATYESARRERPDRDDVLLWNETGELTESTIANLVLELDGRRVTPPVASGLLSGILRTELVERGELVERILNTGDLARAPRVWLVNSLRGFVEATVE
jgi:para-aminobenzoate synthetase/4-amino-4-deoxychorismate lyase